MLAGAVCAFKLAAGARNDTRIVDASRYFFTQFSSKGGSLGCHKCVFYNRFGF